MIHLKVRDTTDSIPNCGCGWPWTNDRGPETRYSTAAPNCDTFSYYFFPDNNTLTTLSSCTLSHSFLHSSNRRSFDLLDTSAKPLNPHRLLTWSTAPHFFPSWQHPPTGASRPRLLNPTMLPFTSQGDGKPSPGLRSLTTSSLSPIVRLACLFTLL